MRKYFLPYLIAVVYWLWTKTWRLEIIEHPETTRALNKGRVSFAHWHGDEMVLVSIGKRYHCAAMTSTSKDGELMTGVLRCFGFGISRGSSTRGGARALVGMIKLIKEGFNATVAVDGPKGPIYKVKPGIWHLAKHSQEPVVPVGVSASSGHIFEKSWNKGLLPWPFAKVKIVFGPPLPPPLEITPTSIVDLQQGLEVALTKQKTKAQELNRGS